MSGWREWKGRNLKIKNWRTDPDRETEEVFEGAFGVGVAKVGKGLILGEEFVMMAQ